MHAFNGTPVQEIEDCYSYFIAGMSDTLKLKYSRKVHGIIDVRSLHKDVEVFKSYYETLDDMDIQKTAQEWFLCKAHGKVDMLIVMMRLAAGHEAERARDASIHFKGCNRDVHVWIEMWKHYLIMTSC